MKSDIRFMIYGTHVFTLVNFRDTNVFTQERQIMLATSVKRDFLVYISLRDTYEFTQERLLCLLLL